MAIHLHEKWNPTMVKGFTKGSILASRLTDQFKWDGVRAIIVSSPVTVAPVDYNRNGGRDRFGAIKDVQDTAQRMEVLQDKGWILSIDAGNASEQQKEKKAADIMVAQTNEQDIPYCEKYAFNKIAHLAGKIVGSATALTAANITTRISAGLSYMNGKSVPGNGRTVFINAAGYQLLVDSGKTLYASRGIVDKAWAKGKVDEYGGADIVLVPDDRWPAHLNFLIVHKQAACMPYKLKNTRIMEDVGIDGDVLRNHYIFDAFVIGRKCDGVYADVNTGSGAGTVLAAPTMAADGKVTQANAGVIYVTTDGSDPRYSISRVAVATGTAPTHAAGDIVKAVAMGASDAVFASPVAEIVTTS